MGDPHLRWARRPFDLMVSWVKLAASGDWIGVWEWSDYTHVMRIRIPVDVDLKMG